MGIVLITMDMSIKEVEVRYDNKCTNDEGELVNPCVVDFTVDETIESPVFFYYGLTNFYQNHRKYLISRDHEQLNGEIKSVDDLDDCEPVYRNRDVKTPLYAWGNPNEPLDPDDPANPCGLVAKSFFTDRYELEDAAGETITMLEDGIAWDADVENKFKRAPNSENV
mmetsp:Transcript_28166/g.24944  ORF Transcript_28166/g.24944 Transcript_28166/m.24944 type:complete len:167 (+) Transcript_28166:202-702(+)